MKKITIDDKQYKVESGMTFYEIAAKIQPENLSEILLVKADGRLRELQSHLREEKRLEFLTISDAAGYQSYERGCLFVLLKAIHEILPELPADDINVKFHMSTGFFLQLGNLEVKRALCNRLKKVMQRIIDAKIPFHKMNMTVEDVINIFHEQGMHNKALLYRYHRAARATIYDLDGYMNYFFGSMPRDTGYIRLYDLLPVKNGLFLVFPSLKEPHRYPDKPICEMNLRERLASEEWADEVGLSTVADLNERTVKLGFNDIILMQEAHMEKKIGDIAESIASMKNCRIILISGPSSSGKTTFSYRLGIQLRARGYRPLPIETDNYFVNRADTPRDQNGNYDFECLEALDLNLLRKDLKKLLQGKRIELPKYNFLTGEREYRGDYLELQEKDILVIEGIHCLDDRFLDALPQASKYKIFLSAISPMNLDRDNPMHASDARLLRRMIRDNRSRGYDASHTLKLWPSVLHGEELYIEPFRKNADVMLNSSLIYELPVLKPYAEALLFSVDKEDPNYAEAVRLLKMLEYFLTIPREMIPNNSILCEFIGGSAFSV